MRITHILLFLFVGLIAHAVQPQAQVSVPIASLRSVPAHSAEMETQLLMGAPVCIIDSADEWYRVIAPDGYDAYIPMKSVAVTDTLALAQWRQSPRVIVTSPRQSVIYADTVSFSPLSPSFPGAILVKDFDDAGRYLPVRLPDGRCGFVAKECVEDFADWSEKPALREEIISFAMALMGTPYLWGGDSPAGIDCSGFTQLCYLMGGRMLLPRNASAQAARDEQTDTLLHDADLIFMGNEQGSDRISHVGLYAGGSLIHSSGQVRIDADFLAPAARFPRRIIKTTSPLRNPTPISHHPWYF